MDYALERAEAVRKELQKRGWENIRDFELTLGRLLAAEIQAAILAEREECAKTLERFGDDSYTAESRNHAYQHAKVIRARSQSVPIPPEIASESPKIKFAGHQPD